MSNYLIINLVCMCLILFANLGISANVFLLLVQFGVLILQYKEMSSGKN